MGEGGACFEEARETVDFVVPVVAVGTAAEVVVVAGEGGGGREHWTVEARDAFCSSGRNISCCPTIDLFHN